MIIEKKRAATENIKNLIFSVRGVQVMFDSDLAEMYGVEVKVLNQAVKRNIDRFPEKFRFQLTQNEWEGLRSQIVTLKEKRGFHRKYLPYVFTEQGVSMLSAVLRSEAAIEVSIQIIDAFVEMRRFISQNAKLFQRISHIEQKQIASDVKQLKTEYKIDAILNAIEERDITPKQGIFYDGQVYDAYTFVSNLIRKAKKSLVLIDNYVDDSVLTLLSKRKAKVQTTIYTKSISKQLSLDLKKYNEQYEPISIEISKNSHDRFLIIDKKDIFHIGASLKDLGKKWFAFSKFESGALGMLDKLGVKHD